MSTSSSTLVLVGSITTALVGSGAIFSLTFFDAPMIKDQPADRSMPAIRWVFSRGSHVFPPAALLSTVGFISAGYSSLPAASRSLAQLIRIRGSGSTTNAYLLAAFLAGSIAPFTILGMTNLVGIRALNLKLGGSRSMASAQGATTVPYEDVDKITSTFAEDEGQGAGQYTDLSGPQTVTERKSTQEEDEEARSRLELFAKQNFVRGMLFLASGVLGLITALEQVHH